MIIHWKPSYTASCVHIARWALAADPYDAISEPFQATAQTLSTALSQLAPAEEQAPWALLQRSAIEANNADELVLRLPSGWSSTPSFCKALQGLLGKVSSQYPDLAEQLPARVRPLREQWEARAPGFLRVLQQELGAAAEKPLTLGLVTPVLGGYGAACGEGSAVIEAVLYHPVPTVPEPVRVGWLVAKHIGKPQADSSNRCDSRLLLGAVQRAAHCVEWLSANVRPEDLAAAWSLEI